MPEQQLSVLVVGKSGSGKSSVANALLTKNAFPVGSGLEPTTAVCQVDSNLGLTVADTPDLSAFIGKPHEARRALQPAFDRCSSGFNAVLLVMRLDVRLTEEELGVASLVQELLGARASSGVVLVFTHGDRLESDAAFRELMGRQRSGFPALDRLMRECGERWVMLNAGERSSAERLERDREQLMELLRHLAESSPTSLVRLTNGAERHPSGSRDTPVQLTSHRLERFVRFLRDLVLRKSKCVWLLGALAVAFTLAQLWQRGSADTDSACSCQVVLVNTSDPCSL